MSGATRHGDWLDLMDISGPFLAEPVLDRAFPQGLDQLDPLKRKILRQAYDEWREALDLGDAQLPELHRAWIDLVLKKGLELDENGKGEVLKSAAKLLESSSCPLPEYGITLTPDFVLVDDRHEDKPMMLIRIHDPGVKLDETIRDDGWATTPADRMVHLCRATKTRLGLITNGERWMLVDASEGGITTYASWYSRFWGQEPVTLQSFVALLGIRRFFVDESEQLPVLFDESLKHQDEVTESLGEQVRRAVEVLIQALDRADVDRNRELLHGVEPSELYEAGLTVMMRLVFLLCAEERDLLLLGEERYEANYAISTLRIQLRGESEEILERRWDAWSRLLSVFRFVYGGIEHETLRMPALGGSLFDPDRFPFLEGRAKATNWRFDEAKPLPIDNRTVLLLLEAIQMHQGRALSYRALDVEQIGYVYEGLLERTAVRAKEVTLDLDATRNADKPWAILGEVESAKLDGVETLEELFRDRTGSSISRVRNDLKKPVDETAAERLLTACHGEQTLRDRIKPYFHLLRTDSWGYPLVYPKDAYMVTTGGTRRETGTHYTPKSLTEAIVAETLTPVVYVGPAEGKPREEWTLKSPAELLDLKICDPAMGSGAFLVQVCRWLAERLVEAWNLADRKGKAIDAEGEVVEDIGNREPLTTDAEGRSIVARRLIAERCLYGVDINPLAVELAKLSIWLVTLAKGRPFGFLDHNLRCGDSLLGIHRLDQLTELSMNPGQKNTQMRVFGRNIDQAVREAIELRQRLREIPIRDIHDVETMARLDADARHRLETPEWIADALIGEVLRTGDNGSEHETALASLAIQAENAINGDQNALRKIIGQVRSILLTNLPDGRLFRRPLQWPLEFPEVFSRGNAGFDAVIGNPPFLWGMRISTHYGDEYLRYLQIKAGRAVGTADLCAHFFLRAAEIVNTSAFFGMLATETISTGDTREVSLDALLNRHFTIYSAISSVKWPGKASVSISCVHISKGPWRGVKTLDGNGVDVISSHLTAYELGVVRRLISNVDKMFIGHYPMSNGFILEEDVAISLLKDSRNALVIFPYLVGQDVNLSPHQKASRWIINFGRMSEADAREFRECFGLVDKFVRPQRMKTKRKANRERWWQYAETRPGLCAALAEVDGTLVQPFVSKYINPVWVDKNQVFASPMVVIARDAWNLFPVLQSNLHDVFCRFYASTLGGTLRYAPTDCFEPFPLPRKSEECRIKGKEYHDYRKLLMQRSGLGLTKIYNKLHDFSDRLEGIEKLREHQVIMDKLVAAAYGWADIDLNHDFYKVPYLPKNDNNRFTISENARLKVLRRLSELNRQRYEEEVALGLHGVKATKAKSTPTRTTAKKTTTQSGFAFDVAQVSKGKKP
jgi:hypothetical protein